MKGGTAAGYTIVEVLIVLAVSMMLLVSAGFFISRRQAKTEFAQAIRSLQGEIQQTMNEVASGYYPNLSGINCFVTPPNTIMLNSNPGNDTQGSNKDCIFLGRVLQFNTDSPNRDTYNVFTVVGLNNQTSYGGANPRVIARGTTEPASIPDEYETRKLRGNLQVAWIRYWSSISGSGVWYDIPAIGFISNLNQSGVGDGTQTVNAMRIGCPIAGAPIYVGGPLCVTGPADVTVPMTTPEAVDYINKNLPIVGTNGIYICVNSGTTRQSGRILVGENMRYNSVELKIYSNPGCV
jgi:type II secretory pathway pseudopilin PulG